MKGTIVNFFAVLIFGSLGTLVGRFIPERVRKTTVDALGLAVVFIGISLASKTQKPVILIFSIALGSAIGEILGIEQALEALGKRVEKRFGGGDFAKGFVTSSLVFCVGSMAIVGSLQDALMGDPTILYAKSALDSVAALAFSTVFGIGTAFAAFSVLAYQGSITLLASVVANYLTQEVIQEAVAAGGLAILAIGINLLEISKKKLRAGNMIPAIVVAGVTAYFV